MSSGQANSGTVSATTSHGLAGNGVVRMVAALRSGPIGDAPDRRRAAALGDPGQMTQAHRHGRYPDDGGCRLATFQTSPQSPQRQ